MELAVATAVADVKAVLEKQIASHKGGSKAPAGGGAGGGAGGANPIAEGGVSTAEMKAAVAAAVAQVQTTLEQRMAFLESVSGAKNKAGGGADPHVAGAKGRAASAAPFSKVGAAAKSKVSSASALKLAGPAAGLGGVSKAEMEAAVATAVADVKAALEKQITSQKGGPQAPAGGGTGGGAKPSAEGGVSKAEMEAAVATAVVDVKAALEKQIASQKGGPQAPAGGGAGGGAKPSAEGGVSKDEMEAAVAALAKEVSEVQTKLEKRMDSLKGGPVGGGGGAAQKVEAVAPAAGQGSTPSGVSKAEVEAAVADVKVALEKRIDYLKAGQGGAEGGVSKVDMEAAVADVKAVLEKRIDSVKAGPGGVGGGVSKAEMEVAVADVKAALEKQIATHKGGPKAPAGSSAGGGGAQPSTGGVSKAEMEAAVSNAVADVKAALEKQIASQKGGSKAPAGGGAGGAQPSVGGVSKAEMEEAVATAVADVKAALEKQIASHKGGAVGGEGGQGSAPSGVSKAEMEAAVATAVVQGGAPGGVSKAEVEEAVAKAVTDVKATLQLSLASQVAEVKTALLQQTLTPSGADSATPKTAAPKPAEAGAGVNDATKSAIQEAVEQAVATASASLAKPQSSKPAGGELAQGQLEAVTKAVADNSSKLDAVERKISTLEAMSKTTTQPPPEPAPSAAAAGAKSGGKKGHPSIESLYNNGPKEDTPSPRTHPPTPTHTSFSLLQTTPPPPEPAPSAAAAGGKKGHPSIESLYNNGPKEDTPSPRTHPPTPTHTPFSLLQNTLPPPEPAPSAAAAGAKSIVKKGQLRLESLYNNGTKEDTPSPRTHPPTPTHTPFSLLQTTRPPIEPAPSAAAAGAKSAGKKGQHSIESLYNNGPKKETQSPVDALSKAMADVRTRVSTLEGKFNSMDPSSKAAMETKGRLDAMEKKIPTDAIIKASVARALAAAGGVKAGAATKPSPTVAGVTQQEVDAAISLATANLTSSISALEERLNSLGPVPEQADVDAAISKAALEVSSSAEAMVEALKTTTMTAFLKMEKDLNSMKDDTGSLSTLKEQVPVLESQLRVVTQLVDGKADASELSSLAQLLDGKAEASELSGLAQLVEGKADGGALSSLAELVPKLEERLQDVAEVASAPSVSPAEVAELGDQIQALAESVVANREQAEATDKKIAAFKEVEVTLEGRLEQLSAAVSEMREGTRKLGGLGEQTMRPGDDSRKFASWEALKHAEAVLTKTCQQIKEQMSDLQTKLDDQLTSIERKVAKSLLAKDKLMAQLQNTVEDMAITMQQAQAGDD
eukprot:gene15501-21588_t